MQKLGHWPVENCCTLPEAVREKREEAEPFSLFWGSKGERQRNQISKYDKEDLEVTPGRL